MWTTDTIQYGNLILMHSETPHTKSNNKIYNKELFCWIIWTWLDLLIETWKAYTTVLPSLCSVLHVGPVAIYSTQERNLGSQLISWRWSPKLTKLQIFKTAIHSKSARQEQNKVYLGETPFQQTVWCSHSPWNAVAVLCSSQHVSASRNAYRTCG